MKHVFAASAAPLTTCVAASCGDGFVQDGVETCDDQNEDDTDDCPSTCVTAFCGDGFVQAEVDQCDDGNDANDDGDVHINNNVPTNLGDDIGDY